VCCLCCTHQPGWASPHTLGASPLPCHCAPGLVSCLGAQPHRPTCDPPHTQRTQGQIAVIYECPEPNTPHRPTCDPPHTQRTQGQIAESSMSAPSPTRPTHYPTCDPPHTQCTQGQVAEHRHLQVPRAQHAPPTTQPVILHTLNAPRDKSQSTVIYECPEPNTPHPLPNLWPSAHSTHPGTSRRAPSSTSAPSPTRPCCG